MAFQYHRPTREQIAARQDQKTQIIDPAVDQRFKTFRPKEGRNSLRFLPPTWRDHKGWPALDVWMHRNIGPDNGSYLCLRRHLQEPCPICEERQALDDEGDTEAAKQLYPRKTRVAWVIDRKDEDAGPLVWVYGYTIDEEIAGRCTDSKTGAELFIDDPDEGYDVSFRRGNERPFPKTTQIEIDRSSSPLSDDPKWQEYYLNFVSKNPLPDILVYYSYEHIRNVLHGKSGKTAVREPVDERPSHRGAPPTEDYDENDRPPPPRRSAPQEDENRPPRKGSPERENRDDDNDPPFNRSETDSRRALHSNGHADETESTSSQASRQIAALKEEETARARSREETPPPRRRATVPDDEPRSRRGDEDPPPPRRRPPPA